MTWTLRAPIPGSGVNAMREYALGAIGSKLYLAGGIDIDGFVVFDTWEWDRPTNTWTAKANMPDNRATQASAVLAGKLYSAGGQDFFNTVTASLYEYTPGTDAWATKASMPAARLGPSGAACNGKLYVSGGSTTALSSGATATLYEWTPNTWATKASMGTARWLHASAAIGTLLYVCGGLDSSGNPLDSLEVWDQGTNSWSTLAPMPGTQFAHALVAGGTKLYAIGGADGTGKDLLEYDPATDTWTDLSDPLPLARAYIGAAVIGIYLYVPAGYEGGNKDTLYQRGAASDTGGPSSGGNVWAVRGDFPVFAQGDLNWAGDGSAVSGLIFPPDTDAWDSTDLGGTAAWYAGGSDGTFHYQLAIDATGQWWVDKFDAAMGSLLDRWEITGWVSDFSHVNAPADSWEPSTDTQHVTADGTHVVVIGHRYEDDGFGSYNYAAIETTVFDLTGTILNQWSFATPITSGDYDRIGDFTGTCLVDGALIFDMFDHDSNEIVCSIDLSTGTLTKLFGIYGNGYSLLDVDTEIAALDPSWAFPQGLRSVRGIIEFDSDLILAGFNGIARVQMDGTPIWWAPTDGTDHFVGLSHSGRDSLWACLQSADANEYQYDGTYVQTITLVEPAQQAWLVGAARGGWSVDVLFF